MNDFLAKPLRKPMLVCAFLRALVQRVSITVGKPQLHSSLRSPSGKREDQTAAGNGTKTNP